MEESRVLKCHFTSEEDTRESINIRVEQNTHVYPDWNFIELDDHAFYLLHLRGNQIPRPEATVQGKPKSGRVRFALGCSA